jgi:putative protease
MPRDLLRIGYEDDPWHTTIGLRRHVPKKGKFHLAPFFLNPTKKSPKKPPPKGTPVFLVDRGEPDLSKAISDLESQIPSSSNAPPHKKSSGPRDRTKADTTRFMGTMSVVRLQGPNPSRGLSGVWLTPENAESSPNPAHVWWWLSPGIWPENQAKTERTLGRLWKKGARKFVLNAPWQLSLFKNQNCELWAGPFCNIANVQALSVLMKMGFAGAFPSPELGKDELLSLPKHSPLPLGVLIFGGWPLSISRFLGPDLSPGAPFTSPKGETAYARKYDGMYWIFPNWRLDLTRFNNALKKAGYVLMARLSEPLPKGVALKKREGIWNWDQGLA